MSKLVVLKLENGSLDTGFTVTLQIGDDGYRSATQLELKGRLPAQPEIYKICERWRLIYLSLGVSLRSLRKKAQISTSIPGKSEFCDLTDSLRKILNDWLDSEQFRPVKHALLSQLNPSEEIRILIQGEDPQLQRIPWHLWDIFNYYGKAEIAFSALKYGRVDRSTGIIPSNRVRILAVLGNSTGIDLQKDRELLEQLPDAEVLFLVEPSRTQLNRELWQDEGYDILFFAGHSDSQLDGNTGCFYINKTEKLTISELMNGLRKSIERGLQIAIFNSCDGLALAQNLADLNIPQVIVMREPVPDLVAHEFLKNFIQGFSSGKSLYVSLREAREQLQGLESDFPGASWLPVLFQNPAALPPTWQELCPLSFISQQQAKNQYLTLSQKGVEDWNMWRAKNYDLVPDLRQINLSRATLTGANLTRVNLSEVDLSGADLSGADLSGADLTSANLTAVQALNTNFEKASLTGACIQDWNINNATNLNGVICGYVYLEGHQQERCPSSGIFAPGEFTKLFKESLATVDLIFRNGVDWKALTYSFKVVQVENEDAHLHIQSIENKGDGVVVIKVSVSPDADKTKIYSDFMKGYELAQKTLTIQHKSMLEDKDKHINQLFDIVNRLQESLGGIPKLGSEKHGIQLNIYGNVGSAAGSVEGNLQGIQEIYAPEQNQSLAEAAAEIQQLLKQLSVTYPTSTKVGELTVVAKAVKEIESKPILKARLIAALKAGGTDAFKEAIDHPLVDILIAAVQGWLHSE